MFTVQIYLHGGNNTIDIIDRKRFGKQELFTILCRTILTKLCKNKACLLNRADSRLASSQWEMSLQSNAISHWLGANLKSALVKYINIIDGEALAPCTARTSLCMINCHLRNIISIDFCENKNNSTTQNALGYVAGDWCKANTRQGNGLLPSGNKPLPNPMLTHIYLWHNVTSLGYI